MIVFCFNCATCHSLQLAGPVRLGLSRYGLRCPQCGAEYAYGKLPGRGRAGFHKPFSTVELVVFPHEPTADDWLAWRRRQDVFEAAQRLETPTGQYGGDR